MDFFTISSSTIDGILAYTGTLIGNAMPIVVVILGIGIGLWILDHFISKR